MGRRRNKYLGTVVPDIDETGLDSPLEYGAIVGAILEDFKNGVIDSKTARGRLLLLYNLAKYDNDLRGGERDTVLKYIRMAMKKLNEIG